MKYCVVELRTQTATFRNPEFQNFHKSLMLPPPTTMIGLAGAALGLSPNSAQAYFEKDEFYIGVYGSSKGLAKDLWKYNTFDGQGSIILKEILFDNHFILVYGCKNEEQIEELFQAFQSPYYALSLGNSDSLAKVVQAQIIEEISTRKEIAHCLIDGDVVSDVFKNIDQQWDFSIYTTSEPITYDLPTQFTYNSDYGVRRVTQRQQISFVGEPMRLNTDKQGITYKNIFIPVFKLKIKSNA